MNDVPGVEYVGPRKRIDGPILLVKPDPEWAPQYVYQQGLILSALGSRAVQVEHVGSTSVPGLEAKPIIDIVLVVADPADEASYVSDLVAAGYALHLREPGWHEHRLLKRESPDVNLHVFGEACPEVDRMMRFRDRLRENPEELALYRNVKRNLAARHWTHGQDYADAKSTIVADILSRAIVDI